MKTQQSAEQHNTKMYELVCGLEVHAELKTKSKMFCSCVNDPFGAPAPNTYTCPVCLGMPGALPVANKKAIEWTIMVGLALHCSINLFSKFDRKHYFYPDLPKGYQISQYDLPFCHDGYLDTSEGRVRIRRIHLEEDTAKLLHETVNGQKVSLVDFNRSSVPLIEIVTEADIKTATQAKEFGKILRHLLRYLDVADCNMQEGGMRLEANVSVRKAGLKTLPPFKVELKNINSFRFMEQAIAYEIDRQSQLCAAGALPIQETRGWNTIKNETFSQRTKEEAEDYRYFPDPDLPPIRISPEHLEIIRAQLPELPSERKARLISEYDLTHELAEIVTTTRSQADWYESLFSQAGTHNLTAEKIVKSIHNKKVVLPDDRGIDTTLKLIADLYKTDEIDLSLLNEAIDSVMQENPDAVAKYRAGETKVLGFFMGQVMRIIKAKIEAELLKKSIIEKLSA